MKYLKYSNPSYPEFLVSGGSRSYLYKRVRHSNLVGREKHQIMFLYKWHYFPNISYRKINITNFTRGSIYILLNI